MQTMTSYWSAYEFVDNDYFEARWVFWVIYLSAWAGLGFAVICFFKSMVEFPFSRMAGFKYLCYCIFWVSSFIWILCMDNTLYHYYFQRGTALVTTMIIGFVCVFFIFLISMKEKKRECYRFYERHNKWAEWDLEAFAQTYPRYTDHHGCPAGCTCSKCKAAHPEESKPLK